MRNYLLTFFILFLSFFLYSQQIPIEIKSGNYTINSGLETNYSKEDPYRIILFNTLPTEEQKRGLNNLGVNFLYYLPTNIFVVSISKDISVDNLLKYDILSINTLLPEYKIDIKLKQSSFPSWSVKDNILYIKIYYRNG